jgi:hypothetical protein
MAWVGYARVSSVGQSLEVQLKGYGLSKASVYRYLSSTVSA